ncbi:MAG: pantoate--beta-alanine ligase [Chloroflexia bacterium]|nr:pantoate--beta-alanine ligase [Chloroflexia bacterium]
MRVLSTVAEMRAVRASLPGLVGLVPTMGYLHDGHLALVRAARAANASVVVSIFVNPAQFGPGEDLATYPRDLDRDLALLESDGVDLVFAPPEHEMYPPGDAVTVDPGPIGARLEGAARPGHFLGVVTVVTKLLGLIQPDRAYFGQKDAQQLAVIEHVVQVLFLPVEIVACPTVRERDGLALSSRNVYLTPTQRVAAPALYRGLASASKGWREGERSPERLRAAVCAEVVPERELRLEYVSVAHPRTLDELETVPPVGVLLSLAARAGRVRLIDNIRLGKQGATE